MASGLRDLLTTLDRQVPLWLDGNCSQGRVAGTRPGVAASDCVAESSARATLLAALHDWSVDAEFVTVAAQRAVSEFRDDLPVFAAVIRAAVAAATDPADHLSETWATALLSDTQFPLLELAAGLLSGTAPAARDVHLPAAALTVLLSDDNVRAALAEKLPASVPDPDYQTFVLLTYIYEFRRPSAPGPNPTASRTGARPSRHGRLWDAVRRVSRLDDAWELERIDLPGLDGRVADLMAAVNLAGWEYGLALPEADVPDRAQLQHRLDRQLEKPTPSGMSRLCALTVPYTDLHVRTVAWFDRLLPAGTLPRLFRDDLVPMPVSLAALSDPRQQLYIAEVLARHASPQTAKTTARTLAAVPLSRAAALALTPELIDTTLHPMTADTLAATFAAVLADDEHRCLFTKLTQTRPRSSFSELLDSCTAALATGHHQ